MPRLRNSQTGAVVSVSDATAARLGGEWVPAEQQEAEPTKSKPAPRRRTAKSKS